VVVNLALDMVSVHDFQLVGHDHITGRIERDGILDGDGSKASEGFIGIVVCLRLVLRDTNET
jgi:hypothetical protein